MSDCGTWSEYLFDPLVEDPDPPAGYGFITVEYDDISDTHSVVLTVKDEDGGGRYECIFDDPNDLSSPTCGIP